MKTAVDKNENELEKEIRIALEWLDRYGKTAPPLISFAVKCFPNQRNQSVTDEFKQGYKKGWADCCLDIKTYDESK